MVKQKTKVTIKILSIFILGLAIFNHAGLTFAADEDTDFNVNVKEVLSVSITTPTTWASGDVDDFLRNPVSLDVVTNNTDGFIAMMTTKTSNTSLINTSKNTITLPTLSANSTRANFPANYWGYSVDDTVQGSGASTYSPLVGAGSTPITILSSQTASSGHKDFYFGAKANITKAAGTYSGTVIVSVVTGVNTNPVTPTNPDTPNPTPNTPTYNPTHGTTTYTYNTSGNGTRTTTTEVSSGDNRSVYEGYTPPQGVTYSTTSRVSNLSALTTGLAIASSVAASSGIFFLFAARREEDTDDEEDENDEF